MSKEGEKSTPNNVQEHQHPAASCIPNWSYSEKFYDTLISGEHLYIKTDPVKGKGLFSSKKFSVGDIALVEGALACSQNVDDFQSGTPCCAACLVSLETPKQIVGRVTKYKQSIAAIPHVKLWKNRIRVTPCKHKGSGCTVVFCSARCRDIAWKSWHSVCCRGRMNDGERAALDEFCSNSWQSGGIDFSDTHFLALRFLSIFLTRYRFHGMPLGLAFLPVSQLIRAPLSKFTFSYLIIEDDDEKEDDDDEKEKDKVVEQIGDEKGKNEEEKSDKENTTTPKVSSENAEKEAKEKLMKKEEAQRQLLRRHWKRFIKYRDSPYEDPSVRKAHEEGPSKCAMIASGMELLEEIFHFSAEERELINEKSWSELLGAVLLNGQERTPSSPYSEFCDYLGHFPDFKEELRGFHRQLKALGFDTSELHASAHGQGVYAIGACFNHSCEPNLQITYSSENDETLVASVIKDIDKDEECFISYINEEMPLLERQQHLYEHYLFHCCCTKCEREKKLPEYRKFFASPAVALDERKEETSLAAAVTEGSEDNKKKQKKDGNNDHEDDDAHTPQRNKDSNPTAPTSSYSPQSTTKKEGGKSSEKENKQEKTTSRASMNDDGNGRGAVVGERVATEEHVEDQEEDDDDGRLVSSDEPS